MSSVLILRPFPPPVFDQVQSGIEAKRVTNASTRYEVWEWGSYVNIDYNHVLRRVA